MGGPRSPAWGKVSHSTIEPSCKTAKRAIADVISYISRVTPSRSAATDQFDKLERVAVDSASFAVQEVQSDGRNEKEDCGGDDREKVLLECKCEVEVIATTIHDWAKYAIRRWQT